MSKSGTSQKVARAARWVVEELEQRVLLSVKAGPQWVEQGPGPVIGDNTGVRIPATSTVGANPVVGAVQAVATPPGARRARAP